MMSKVPAYCGEDYPDFTFDVVSPELPCGAAWLANCLIELNVPVWQPWDTEVENEWKRLAPFHYQYAASEQPWQQVLPALQYLREFRFNPKHAACFRHQWPIAYEKRKRPLVFFVRDPRDALFSYWRRTTHNESEFNLSFENFVHSRFFHHPFSFREYLLIFLQLWKNHLSDADHLVIRYEDYRNSAGQTLKRILNFLNIKTRRTQVHHALACSDFSAIKRVEDQMEKNAQLKNRFSYAGTAYEYQHSYTPAMHESLGADFDDIYQWLGYASYADAFYNSNIDNDCKKSVDALMQQIDSTSEQNKRHRQGRDSPVGPQASNLAFFKGFNR